jgi:hypothetical protein
MSPTPPGMSPAAQENHLFAVFLRNLQNMPFLFSARDVPGPKKDVPDRKKDVLD